jgi:hypothetical protein
MHSEMAQIYQATKHKDPEEFRRFVEYMSSHTNKSWSIPLESILIGSCQYGITRIVKCLLSTFPSLDTHYENDLAFHSAKQEGFIDILIVFYCFGIQNIHLDNIADEYLPVNPRKRFLL